MRSPSQTRWVCSLALASTVLGGLAASAAKPVPALPVAGSAGLAAMVDLETKMADSLQFGHAVPVVFQTAEQLPGQVVSAPYWGDTALWSGVYLGGEAMRYAVAKEHLGTTPGKSSGKGNADTAHGRDKDEFWTAQRDEALDRVRTLLAAEHRDINIAEDWTGELRVPPEVNTQDPLGPHTADFGGGVIQGERGMITRGCTPVGLGPLGINPPNHDAANPINDHSNHVYEITWTHGDGRRYYCETSPSRDTYAGMVFGLLTAHDLVGPDEPALRQQIRDDVLSMASFLLKYGWNYPRPNGYVATGSDENGFVTPLMAHVPMARLNIANAARIVAAGSPEQATWDAVWAGEIASQGPLLGVSMEVDSMQPNQGYFKFNLHHLNGFNLLRTLTGPERDLVARGFAVMDKTTRDDGNAHFEALTFGVTGDPARRDAASTHLEQWLTYSANVAQGRTVRNSTRCGTEITCLPEDTYQVETPAGPVTWFPGNPDAPPLSSPSKSRAVGPLPVALRPPADFLWQRPPTDLDGQLPAAWREPGIDFLTPYWTLRYFTEVAPPAATPLPEWAGPAHL